MACSLEHLSGFSNAPTLCEKDGVVIEAGPGSGSELNHLVQRLLENYPKYEAQTDQKPFLLHDSARSAFLQNDSFSWKKVGAAWREVGVYGALKELLTSRQPDSSDSDMDKLKGGALPGWVEGPASVLYRGLNWLSHTSAVFSPHTHLSCDEMIAKYSQTRDWRKGAVRALAWHPGTVKLAVALRDNSVVICSPSKGAVQPVLKDRRQKGVSALAWRPLCASVLAVACESCVLLWTVEPTSLAARPATSLVQEVTWSSFGPITGLAWSTSGRLLLASSPASSAVLAYEPARCETGRLTRRGDGGVTGLSVSPDGSRLLAATAARRFRVWDTVSWTCEKWTNLSDSLQSWCWSHDGSVLLFCTRDQPVLLALTFPPTTGGEGVGGAPHALPVADLAEVICPSSGGDADPIRVGGLVHQLAWSPDGARLAVIFKGREGEGCPCIALFLTHTRPSLEIIPCGLIRGEGDEVPDTMTFLPSFSHGSLLTVAWSSGRVSHVPLLYNTAGPGPAAPNLTTSANGFLSP